MKPRDVSSSSHDSYLRIDKTIASTACSRRHKSKVGQAKAGGAILALVLTNQAARAINVCFVPFATSLLHDREMTRRPTAAISSHSAGTVHRHKSEGRNEFLPSACGVLSRQRPIAR